jgi:hypothetical protein
MLAGGCERVAQGDREPGLANPAFARSDGDPTRPFATAGGAGRLSV